MAAQRHPLVDFAAAGPVMMDSQSLHPNVEAAPASPQPSTLSGSHVLLRPIEPNDTAALYQIELSPRNIYRWRFRGSTPSPEQYARSLFDGVLVSFIVEHLEKRSISGVVTCYNADLKNGIAYIAALTAESQRRTPVALEGLELLIDYCFQNWQFRKLYFESPEYSQVDFASAPPNLLRHEGRLVDHEFFDGQYWDRMILALHRRDWQGYRDKPRLNSTPRTPDQFLTLVRDELLLESNDLQPSTRLDAASGLDSLALYSLVVLVEDLAGEAVPEPVVRQWRTLDDVYAWLEARVH